MKRVVAVVLVVLATAAAAHAANVEVVWDTWGVPHIYADDYNSLAFGHGYAQARDHVSSLLKFVGTARGRAAEYWGPTWRQLDLRTLGMRIPDYARDLYYLQDPEAVDFFEAYAAGFTHYIDEHPNDPVYDGLLQVLPVSGIDFFAHGMRTYWEFSFATGYSATLPTVENGDNNDLDEQAEAKQRSRRPKGTHFAAYDVDWEGEDRRRFSEFKDAWGSNAWAINGVKADGNGPKLNVNPHLPYLVFFRWYEAHHVVASEDFDFYGAGFLGVPNLQLGFNKFVGWSHTVNVGQPWTVYDLELINGNQYYFDGVLYTLEEQEYTFLVKQEDGTFIEETILIEKSLHGDISQRVGNHAVALRLAGTDRPNPLFQWSLMERARSMDEFKDAMRNLQISMFTTIAASHDGDIMASFNGFVPRRSSGDFAFWNKPVPGNSSLYLWTELHTWDELPRVDNPESGFVQNCNEPPWAHSLPLYQRGANPNEYPPYMSRPPSMGWRPQASVRLLQSKDNLTFDEFSALKHSTLVEFGNHAVDDLISAIAEHGNGEIDLQLAANILSNWDRHADAQSTGYVLFKTWAKHAPTPMFANPWSDQDPLGTPNTLADPAGSVEALREAIREMRVRGLALDVPWGDVHHFPAGRRPSLSIPGHGDSDTFRNVWWIGDQLIGPGGGDSIVIIVEFTPSGPKAKSLLGYGNATPYSRGGDVFLHINDQFEMFANKQLKEVLLERADIEANLEERAYLEF